MQVVWLESAKIDLENYVNYFSGYGFLETKEDFLTKIKKVTKILEGNPFVGKLSGIQNVREFALPKLNCILIYTVINKRVYLLRLFDSRQDPENKFY